MIKVEVHSIEKKEEVKIGDIVVWTHTSNNNHVANKPVLVAYNQLILLEDPSCTWDLGIDKDYDYKFIKRVNEYIKSGELKKIYPEKIILYFNNEEENN